MSPFLQLPLSYLLDPQALTKTSEPYSENNTAALGGAHPGSWCFSRQTVVQTSGQTVPLGSGTKLDVLWDGSSWSLYQGNTKATEPWLTTDTLFLQENFNSTHSCSVSGTTQSQRARGISCTQAPFLFSRISFASHRASRNHSLTFHCSKLRKTIICDHSKLSG